MLGRFLLALGVCAMALAASPSMAAPAANAPQSLVAGAAAFDGLLVHRAQYGYRSERYQYGRFWGYYSRCHYRRRECARRWGWGTWRYRRCVHWQVCRAR